MRTTTIIGAVIALASTAAATMLWAQKQPAGRTPTAKAETRTAADKARHPEDKAIRSLANRSFNFKLAGASPSDPGLTFNR